MKKVYILKGLDCPHCAAEIEAEVGKLPGVASAAVNLMNQSLTIQTRGNTELTQLVEKIVHAHEPEVRVMEGEMSRQEEDTHETRNMVIRLIMGGVLFGLGLGLSFWRLPKGLWLGVLIAAYVVLGGDVVKKAVRNIIQGRIFDENFLMSLSSIGAFCLGEHHEAVAVMLFYQIGEFFQEQAVRRSRKSISSLMDIRPDSAAVSRDGHISIVSPENVEVGEFILVKPGEKIPLDGVVLEGASMLDTRALTGESVPRAVRPGDTALSGCVNGSGMLVIQVTKTFGQSTASRIIDLVENAASRKAPTENFITKFARYYTPAVVIIAALLAVIPPLFLGNWTEWIRRGFVFLVISCPCALVISIPLTFFGGIGAASRHGVLVKGSNYLEALNNVGTVVFDKTGTLTKGVFHVTEIIPAEGFKKEEVLACAAAAEYFSGHPIAASIRTAYRKEIDQTKLSDYREIPGHGICVKFRGKQVLCGNGLLLEGAGIAYASCEEAGTKVYVAAEGRYMGCIRIADELKADSEKTIRMLKRMDVEKTVMLTGDEQTIAGAVACQLGLDEYHAGLLPDEKVRILEQLDAAKPKGSKLAFVGDGINDAPVLARADIGIAMGGLGSDAAIEAADVVLMTDEPGKLVEAIQVAKATRRIVVQNIVIALGIKGVFLVLGAFGIAGMWEAVFADVGVALIAVLNAMRILKK